MTPATGFAGCIIAGLLAVAAGHSAQDATAQEPYPAPGRTIRIVVPHGLGTGPDVLARLIGQQIAERWKASVVVENRVGRRARSAWPTSPPLRPTDTH